MGSFLYADINEPLKYAVNRTTKKFLEYYVSALESLHYISLDFSRMDYEDKEKRKIEKARSKFLTFKESEDVKKKAYKYIKLEDLFKPNKWSTEFIDMFDQVNLPYFDSSGKLMHSSPNSLLKEAYESLYLSSGYAKFGFAEGPEKTMIIKGNALIKRSKSKADYSNEFIREELETLTNKMMEYFLSRTSLLYYEFTEPMVNKDSNISKEYLSVFNTVFNKMKIPVLELELVDPGESFQDSTYKTKKRYLKFVDAIEKKVSEMGYISSSFSNEEQEIRRLRWLVGFNFARETLQNKQYQ